MPMQVAKNDSVYEWGTTKQGGGGQQHKIKEDCQPDSVTSSYFVSLSLEENVVENITQSEDSFQFEVLIHNHKTVHPRLADGVKNGVQSII